MKENNELFTIITCTYNRGGKLNKLFDSLTKQKLFNFKWYVIDDCSTDNTKQVPQLSS